MRVLGVNSVFHDPAAALVVDGVVVAAAEEERFSRRKHGKRPVPFSAWEQPAMAARWCLRQAGLTPADVDLIGFSYDPALVRPAADMGLDDPWAYLRTVYASPPPEFLADELPGLDPARARGGELTEAHADLAASVQRRLEEVLLALAGELHERTGDRVLALAGGTALNCVANTVLHERSPFEHVWVQPAAGDAGTALGAALQIAADKGEPAWSMTGAGLGRGFSDAEIETALRTARVPFERPPDLAGAVAGVLADDGIVAWFQGRSEYGPRALGHRSLLAHPGRRVNLDRLNDVKGREKFRPVAPMVLAGRAADIFSRGPLPSPYLLFVHDVAPDWRDRIPAVVHVDGTARVQTVDPRTQPLAAALLTAFEQRTGLPVLVNTSLNTAGRPMVDDIRDALECFGSTPVDALAIGPFLVRRR